MALTTKLTAGITVAADAALTEVQAASTIEVSGPLLDHHVTQTVQISPGETRQIDLGSVGAPLLLFIRADRDVDVRTTAVDSTPERVAPLVAADATRPGFIIKTGAFTGVWLTNPDDADPVTAYVVIAGNQS